ncbi:HAMP domain-containing sensor histidine kinase [Paludibacter sp.]
MKLLNQSIKYATLPILILIGLWAVFFYFSVYYEIKKSVDEGLDNYKRQIVYQATVDSLNFRSKNFDKGFYTIKSVDKQVARIYKDYYSDTIMMMQDANDPHPEPEPARLLTTAFELNGEYYELKVIHSMIEEDDLVKQIFLNILWFFMLLSFTLAVVNKYALQRLWKPFYAFLVGLRNYRFSDSEKAPAIKTEITEFNDLQNAVSMLINRNKVVYEQQKQFIGNASHELQTPLAITANKLELLAEEGNLTESQAKTVGTLIQSVNRMIRLNKSLLLLSKIENYQFMDDQEVAIVLLVKQELEVLEDIIQYRNISVDILEEAELLVTIDPTLARVVVSNLLRNAIAHNYNGGKLIVNIKANALSVCNSCKNETLDVNKIFLRFYKSDDNKDNSGLGLSIVKAVCDRYNFTVLYHHVDNFHCFQVSFLGK